MNPKFPHHRFSFPSNLPLRLLLLSSLLLVPHQSPATVFLISDPTDTTNLTSLRGAVIAANTAGGDNTILLTANLYPLTLPGAAEFASLTGDLNVTSGNLTIVGSGSINVTLTATNLGDRLFQVSTNAQLTLSNLVLTGGTAPGNLYGTLRAGETAGAILNAGTLILQNCVISSNSSGAGNLPLGNIGGTSAGDGGAIYNTGSLTLLDCTISDNVAGNGTDGSGGGNGGGIFNSGICQLEICLLLANASGDGGDPQGNEEEFAGGAGNGGGIFNSGEMTLSHCAITGNMGGLGGSGGSVDGLVVGVGQSGQSGGSGAGVYNIGTLTLNNCTVSDNFSGPGGNGHDGFITGRGGNGGDGAGIYNSGTLALLTCSLNGNKGGNGGNGGTGLAAPFSGRGGPSNGGLGGDGGNGSGIFNSGEMTALACTINGNLGGDGGIGGDAAAYNGALVTRIGATNGTGGLGGTGGTGGIFNTPTGSANLRNVLIAQNWPAIPGASGQSQSTNGDFFPSPPGTPGSPDLSGAFLSSGHNLIGETNGSTGFTNHLNADLTGSILAPLNPQLGPLSDNSGLTPAFTLLGDSPAIDTGDDALLNSPYNLATDQRGEPRLSGAHMDIGAVEYDGFVNGALQPPLLKQSPPSANTFQFTFNAATQTPFTVLASTNLTTWTNLGPATELSRGYFSFTDPITTNTPHRFYRIHQP